MISTGNGQAEPFTAYLLVRQDAWSAGYFIFGNAGYLFEQKVTTPNVSISATTHTANNSDLTLNTFMSVRYVGNGSSSSLTIGNGTPTTGDPGTASGSDITLGLAFQPASFSIKDFVLQSGVGSDDDWTNMQAYHATIP